MCGQLFTKTEGISSMVDHFNRLTPKEAELIAYIIEECSEVTKAGTKILRHGKWSYDPTLPEEQRTANVIDFQNEVLDVLHAIKLIQDFSSMFDRSFNVSFVSDKEKPLKYFHHLGDK